MESDKKTELLTLINSRGLNVLAIIIGTFVAFIFALKTSSEMPASANMGAIVPLMKAVLLGFITLIGYLSFRKAFKDFSWIITVIGIIYTIYSSTFV